MVNPNPEAVLIADPIVTTSDTPHITFESVLQDGESVVLSTGDGVFYEYIDQNIEHSYPYTENNYIAHVYIENQYGCTDSIEVLIQIKGDEIYYVPNSFTPDGDEHNNTFHPVFTSGYDPMQFEMVIYNRWGQELIRSLNPNEYWDGTYNGVICTEGVYIWKITYVVPESNESKTISGHVNLIR
jgi:gliding motility-associated-like protein